MSNTRSPIRLVLTIAVLLWLVLEIGLRHTIHEEESVPPNVSKDYHALYQPNTYSQLCPNLSLDYTPRSKPYPVNVSTNRYGMREDAVSTKKNSDSVRVAVMGSSVAFGWNLLREENFPTILQTIFDGDSDRHVEVLNFAAPGFTSHHALRQYERLIHNFRPDILILAFGEDDNRDVRLSEKECESILNQHGLSGGKKGFLSKLKRLSAFGRWLDIRHSRTAFAEIAHQIQARTDNGIWVPRVSSEDIEANLNAIIQHHRSQQGKAVLVHTNPLNDFAARPLQKVAKASKVPLLDVREIFGRLGGTEERKRSFTLGLKPAGLDITPPTDSTSMLFRVYSPSAPVHITGDSSRLGSGLPNTVRLYDDGTHGDERARDGVWSLEIVLLEPQTIHFAFVTEKEKVRLGKGRTAAGNESRDRRPFYRAKTPDALSAFYWRSPVYETGRVPYTYLLQKGDSRFPNAMGQKAIAKRLARLIHEAIDS